MTRDYRANPNSRLRNKIRGFCKPRPIGSTWFIENDRYEIFNRQIFISIKGRALDSQPLQQSVTSVWFDLTAITGQRLRYIALYRINVCANRVSVHRLAARQTLMDENYIFTRLLTRLRVTLSHQLWNLCCSIERVDGRVTSFERVARLDKKGEKEAREKENSNKIQQSATLRLKEIQRYLCPTTPIFRLVSIDVFIEIERRQRRNDKMEGRKWSWRVMENFLSLPP